MKLDLDTLAHIARQDAHINSLLGALGEETIKRLASEQALEVLFKVFEGHEFLSPKNPNVVIFWTIHNGKKTFVAHNKTTLKYIDGFDDLLEAIEGTKIK